MSLRHALFLAFLALVASPVYSQQVKDAGLWLGGNVKADVGKKLEATVAPEIRLDENMTRVRGFFSDIGVKKELTDLLSVEAELRVGSRREESWYEGRHRLSLGFGLRRSWADFGAFIQARQQFTPRMQSAESDVDVRQTTRFKGGLKYGGIRKIDLSASFEWFGTSPVGTMTDWRAQCGLERKINKRNFVEIGYLIQKELDSQDMDFVVKVSYTWKLDLDGKKSPKQAQPATN